MCVKKCLAAVLLLAAFQASAATFTVINTNDTGPGSLRQAMLDANVTPSNTIAFNIPVSSTRDIYTFTALPLITNAMTIDGFTQSGSTSNTLMFGNNSTLMINIMPSAQGLGGFNVQTNHVTIRGLGMRLYQVAAIYLQNGTGNVVEGCHLGTDAAGLLDWGNGYMGVRISSSGNRVGGTNAWQHNLIGFGNGAGVGVFSGTNNSILGNSIFAISGFGIDLDYDQRTANDPADSDTGANQRQNFPVLTNVLLNGSTFTVQGTLQTAANQPYRLEFFAGPVNFLPDYGYARDFVAWTNVAVGSSGQTNFSFTFPVPPTVTMPAGYFLCATATDTNGNTSELSAGKQIPNAIYVATPVGTLGHGVNFGTDLNNLGDVVGYAFANAAPTNTHAFLFSHGTMTDLGTLGGYHSFAKGINDSRVVAGYAEIANRNLHAFRWNGSMQDLGTLPGNSTNSWAMGINNAGVIVGFAQYPIAGNSGNTHAVLWQTNGVITDLGTLSGDAGSEAWGISDNGDVVGVSWKFSGVTYDRRFFVRHNGVMTAVPSLSPPYSWPGRINAQGDLAVSVNSADGAPHGYARINNASRDFGLFGRLLGYGNDVNDAGLAVGCSSTPLLPAEAGGTRAVLLRDNNIYDLNALLINPLPAPLRTAMAINNRGVILANNLNQSLEVVLTFGTSPDTTTAYLLYPVQVDANYAGNKIVFSWFTNMTGFTVQTKTNIASIGGWSNVATAPVIIGDHYYLTNAPTDPRRFFRLYKP